MEDRFRKEVKDNTEKTPPTEIQVIGATGNAQVGRSHVSGIVNKGTLSIHGDVSIVVIPDESASNVDSTSSRKSATASSPPLPPGKDYHAFICFNIADQEFVNDTIAYLESPEIGFKCVDHRRDFHAGKTVNENIEVFIEKSWKYVLVMSPDFVTSDSCRLETNIMVNMSVEQREECVVPLLLKPCIIPEALKSMTYLEVKDGWREKLVRDISRADIYSTKLQESKLEMQKKIVVARKNISTYKLCTDNYMQEKRQLELERKSQEGSAHTAFSMLSRRILDNLAKLETRTLNGIHNNMDKRLAALVTKFDKAENIQSEVEKDLDYKALKNFTSLLDEYDELERRQRETSYTEFVMSDCQIEKLVKLMSDVEIGYVRKIDITQIKTQEDREKFLKEISPSWALLPKAVDLTLSSVVRCSHFQFDPMTVKTDHCILLDGSLCNKPPSRPHPPSDRRLKKYQGAVGTARCTRDSVYYWQNSVDVDLDVELEGRDLVFEVALSTRGVIDSNAFLRPEEGSISILVSRCTDHITDRMCLQVYKNNFIVHHQTLHVHPNATGHWPTLKFGFLLDTVSNRLIIYDITKQEEITTVEGIADAEEFIPMFGVYAQNSANIKLSLITGTDLNISDDMYRLILRALE